jgi:peptide/nickel transport system substrate-binding protein
MAEGPFVNIWQQIEVAGVSGKLKSFKLGPTFDSNFLAPVSKD